MTESSGYLGVYFGFLSGAKSERCELRLGTIR
jgi:hypothetical protein